MQPEYNWNQPANERNLIGYYVTAHKMALEKRYPGQWMVPTDPELDVPREAPEAVLPPIKRRAAGRRSKANKD